MGGKTISLQLRLLGTATSQGVPVIGCHCATCRSRDPRDKRLRSSAVLSTGATNLNIDAGPDFRTQMLRARVEQLEGILLTHEHNDHTAGLDDVRPFCFMQEMDMPIYCLPRVAAELKERFAYTFGNYPGVPRLDLREVSFGDGLQFGEERLRLLRVQHGNLPILGFRIRSLAYLTDVKTLPDETLDQLSGLDTLIISCLNYHGTHSHLSVDEMLGYARRIGAVRTVLIHMSHRVGPHAEFQEGLPPGIEVGYDGMLIDIA
ncbi:phosphoribosyl 1,2-cyclic phosphate phosphodiesterase [Neolewinella xylanilytica]|uniref:Phosphoribosyl 1,2-cyclic phosphate phosphodiesterase n=1 Tax=Neolewinella xylanilytica TaxID=1514080 RepID=A0A2S6I455_9BACT|nr:MBL fold metallo-hydrolase [Neolewinella xylanilytica]PPK85943.1 phosphoribosyl 1,2-cyclic phosphate phosphodiesterase [Neolewinella xylanilytica]